MELKLFRKSYSNRSTIGELHINGIFFCYTLEDTCRDKNRNGFLDEKDEAKIFGQTCIPSGYYPVVMTFSNRFKQYMPLLLNVFDFEGVRIHWGNSAKDTEGCILLGSSLSQDFIGNSRDTYERLMVRLKAIEKIEKITITIYDLQIDQAA